MRNARDFLIYSAHLTQKAVTYSLGTYQLILQLSTHISTVNKKKHVDFYY